MDSKWENRGLQQQRKYSQLRTANAKLRTPNAKLRTANAKLRTANAKLRTANAKLRTANAKLRTANAKLRLCHQAGIAVTMVTGDYGLTAEAIARRIGLVANQVRVVTGDGLGHLSDAQLRQIRNCFYCWV